MTTPADPTATPQSTRAEFTRLAARGFTPIRHILVQCRRRDRRYVGGKLGELVEARQPRALNAYLMLLTAWPFLEERDLPLEASVWARALSPAAPVAGWSPSAMTRVWEELEDENLVSRAREARLVRVTPRREDGRGEYSRPRPDADRAAHAERYFILPDAYWTAEWHQRLDLPGRAVLLILLSQTSARDEAVLPYEQAPAWYGISPKTAQRGIDELRRHRLLAYRQEWVRADLSGIGRTQHTHYRLLDAFASDARRKLQQTTREEARARTSAARRPRASTRPRTAARS